MKHHFKIAHLLFIIITLSCPFAAAHAADISHQINDPHLRTALDDYIARPDPAFRWNVKIKQSTFTVLDMDSQRWQDEIWHHEVIVVPPTTQNLYPDTAVMLINYGDMISTVPLMRQAANLLGATVVVLDGIPNQPRWDKREDALIAYTFKKWYEGGDDTWPLLLPMTQSAIKAMDAVQEFTKKENRPDITKFVILGGSKRGWTTWLVGAEDNRVVGIIPIVFNMLNFSQQLPHQKEIFGDYSEMIRAYTEINLPEALKTPRGQELEKIVDPWSYRERITLPKLIINGTNDPYFGLDPEIYYRDGLRGPTNFYDVPNAGHGAGMSIPSLMGTMVGWFRWLKSGKEFPILHLSREESKLVFQLHTSAQAKAATLWVAYSPTQDFRSAKWNAIKMQKNGDAWQGKITPAPNNAKFTAIIGEAEYAVPGTFLPMKLSSQIEIVNIAQ